MEKLKRGKDGAEAGSLANTLQYKLENFNPGMVWLDREQRIVALNDIALQILGPTVEQSGRGSKGGLIGSDVFSVHPPKSHEKVKFLLRGHEQVVSGAEQTTDAGPMSHPPIAMMINIPDRMLVVKVSEMMGLDGISGACMVFYDLTDETTTPGQPVETTVASTAAPRLLSRIPVYRRNRIMLIDVREIARFEGEGHYTKLVTPQDQYLCNLSMSVLEARLDPITFLRVHRSHIVNLNFAIELLRENDGIQIVMPENMGPPVPVSKNKVAAIKEFFCL